MLAAIERTVSEHHGETTGATDMLRLQSARMATEAAISQAQVALIEAQYALALRIGTVAETGLAVGFDRAAYRQLLVEAAVAAPRHRPILGRATPDRDHSRG